ncbi:unnamed protein product [Orchesella dallaii]|uniref:CCHC-type domain-containing protein n=1 Tax=Orchesella dallaii TaxID=48710 RepID=A0ABP1RQ48_9HEXA
MQEVLPIVLEDEAAAWLRLETLDEPFRDWSDFRRRFRQVFQPMDYYEQLSYELTNRTQGPDEPLTTYLWNIIEFHQRLESPWSAQDIIRRVAKGLNPDYQTCIRDILRSNTLGELRTAALEAETALQRRRSYKPPSTESLEPACAYRPTQQELHTQQENVEYDRPRSSSAGESDFARKRISTMNSNQVPRPPTPKDRGVSFNLQRNQNIETDSQRAHSPRTNTRTPPTSPTFGNRRASVTCHRCKQLGHYANECSERDTPLIRQNPD